MLKKVKNGCVLFGFSSIIDIRICKLERVNRINGILFLWMVKYY